jgi:hypothetical protein
VVGVDRVVGVAFSVVLGGRSQFLEGGWVDRCLVGDDLGWAWAVFEGAGEEPVGGCQVPLRGHQ